MIGRDGDLGTRHFAFGSFNQELRFRLYPTPTVLDTTTVALTTNVWRFIAARWDGTDMKIFANNGDTVQEYASVAKATMESASTKSLHIAVDRGPGDGTRRDWHGDVDELVYSDKALSLTRLQAYYDASKDGCPEVETCTLEKEDDVLLLSCAGLVNLSPAADMTGHIYYLKNTSGGTVTLNPNGSETIDNAPTLNLGPMDSVGIQSDGSEWWILADR